MTTADIVEERRPGTAPDDDGRATEGARARQGFLSRHRLPLLLAAVALCGYIGSIVYIVYVRGQL